MVTNNDLPRDGQARIFNTYCAWEDLQLHSSCLSFDASSYFGSHCRKRGIRTKRANGSGFRATHIQSRYSTIHSSNRVSINQSWLIFMTEFFTKLAIVHDATPVYISFVGGRASLTQYQPHCNYLKIAGFRKQGGLLLWLQLTENSRFW